MARSCTHVESSPRQFDHIGSNGAYLERKIHGRSNQTMEREGVMEKRRGMSQLWQLLATLYIPSAGEPPASAPKKKALSCTTLPGNRLSRPQAGSVQAAGQTIPVPCPVAFPWHRPRSGPPVGPQQAGAVCVTLLSGAAAGEGAGYSRIRQWGTYTGQCPGFPHAAFACASMARPWSVPCACNCSRTT